MMITDEMVTAFEDADYITEFAKTLEDQALMRGQIRVGLRVVAPLIADQAGLEFTEQGARLQQAERLLARARAVLINGRTADDIREFLGDDPGAHDRVCTCGAHPSTPTHAHQISCGLNTNVIS